MAGLLDPRTWGGLLAQARSYFGPGLLDQMAAEHARFQQVAGAGGLAAAMQDPALRDMGLGIAGNLDFTGTLGPAGHLGYNRLPNEEPLPHGAGSPRPDESGRPQGNRSLLEEPVQGGAPPPDAGRAGGFSDPEGRPLGDARRYIGRGPDGADQRSLSPSDAEAVAQALAELRVNPRLRDSGLVTSRPGDRPLMEISDRLAPARRDATMRHELGHVGELLGRAQAHFGVMPGRDQTALLNEMRRASRLERPEYWSRHATPKPVDAKAARYVDTLPELYADAQARYAADPEGMKRDFPRAAAFVRQVWNGSDRLRPELAFNALAPLGLLAPAPDQGP